MSEPYFSDDAVTLYHGDCLDVLAELPDASVDSVVTDPPYGLEFMGKDWDSFGRDTSNGYREKPRITDRAGREGSLSAFTGAAGKGVNHFQAGPPFHRWCQLWAAECLRVLKPGGHLLAFGGTRTWHRLACAVEDAGFEIRDNIAWLYGSGFPKSMDVSKAIDKVSGQNISWFGPWLRQERERRGLTAHKLCELGGFYKNVNHGGLVVNWELGLGLPTADQFNTVCRLLDLPFKQLEQVEREVTQAASRPAVTGETTNFDHRSSSERERRDKPVTDEAKRWAGWGTALKPAFEPVVVARKPLAGTVAANVLAHGVGALNIDGCRVGFRNASDKATVQNAKWHSVPNSTYGKFERQHKNEVLDGADSTPDAGRWPSNVVIDGHAAAEIDRQSGILKSGSRSAGEYGLMGYHGAEVAPMPAISGDEGGASRFFPTFRYQAKAATDERPTANGIAHPTVKPLDLMRWLVRLVTPPGGTVLEPFAGSGTTAEACIHEHMKCIAIEREADYLPLIVSRLTKPIEIGFDFDVP